MQQQPQLLFLQTLDYGTAYNPILYKGATASSDWLLENVDAGTTVTIDAVTEGQMARTLLIIQVQDWHQV